MPAPAPGRRTLTYTMPFPPFLTWTREAEIPAEWGVVGVTGSPFPVPVIPAPAPLVPGPADGFSLDGAGRITAFHLGPITVPVTDTPIP